MDAAAPQVPLELNLKPSCHTIGTDKAVMAAGSASARKSFMSELTNAPCDAWGPALIFLTICFGHDARATLPIFFASVLLSLFPGFGASVQIRSRLHQEECRYMVEATFKGVRACILSTNGCQRAPMKSSQLCQHHGLIHSNQPATCSADQSFVHGPRRAR